MLVSNPDAFCIHIYSTILLVFFVCWRGGGRKGYLKGNPLITSLHLQKGAPPTICSRYVLLEYSGTWAWAVSGMDVMLAGSCGGGGSPSSCPWTKQRKPSFRACRTRRPNMETGGLGSQWSSIPAPSLPELWQHLALGLPKGPQILIRKSSVLFTLTQVGFCYL